MSVGKENLGLDTHHEVMKQKRRRNEVHRGAQVERPEGDEEMVMTFTSLFSHS
jgi:hypothetical protein